MKIILKLLLIAISLTIVAPFLLCWIVPQINGNYIQLDTVQNYSELFYEYDESEIPLYDLQLEEDNAKLTNEFTQKFSTLKFKCVSPFMSAVVRSLGVNSRNRYAHYRFNNNLTHKYSYDDDESIYNGKVVDVVNKSEKIYEISIYKIFDKAYAVADYMPGFMRSGNYDDNGRYSVFEIADCDDLQALMSDKKYNENPLFVTLNNPYINSPFWWIFGVEIVALIINIALIIRDKHRKKLGIKD